MQTKTPSPRLFPLSPDAAAEAPKEGAGRLIRKEGRLARWDTRAALGSTSQRQQAQVGLSGRCTEALCL